MSRFTLKIPSLPKSSIGEVVDEEKTEKPQSLFDLDDFSNPILDFPHIYISSYHGATNKYALHHYNIRAMITLLDLNVPGHMEPPQFDNNRLVLNVSDQSYKINSEISDYFELTYQFIESSRKNGANILVHCVGGISRSSTIVIAYIMKKFNHSFDKAFDIVKSKRDIDPNLGFIISLQDYEKQLHTTELDYISNY